MSSEPRTLTEAIKHFSDPDVALKTIVELRWPNGVCCPTCGRSDVQFIATRRMWECKGKHPRRQFSAKVGTIFEDSPLGLDKWFSAIWMIANCKNGVSSYEIHRAIGVTQKTAWFMLHRIRLAMETGSFLKSGGPAEADETFVGGLAKNMHKARREKVITGTGGKDKAVVIGVLRRGTEKETSKVLLARHVPDASAATLHPLVKAALEAGSELFTDTHKGYRGLAAHFIHETVDHSIEYVRGKVHTNGLENFWSLFKRTLKGTYVSVDPFHLNAYVVEQTFRYNTRKDHDGGRFRAVLGSVSGKRLTYRELVGDVAAPNA